MLTGTGAAKSTMAIGASTSKMMEIATKGFLPLLILAIIN